MQKVSLRQAMISLSAATLVLTAGWLSACPFCSAPSLTLTEQVTQADAAVLAKWVSGTPPKGQDAGTSVYEVIEVVHQPAKGMLKKGGTLSLIPYRPSKVGDQFLLMGTAGGVALDWGSPMQVTEASYQYIKNAPRPEVAPSERMLYFLKFLEHGEPMIAEDAYGEFANTSYGDITQVSKQMPRDQLRLWIADSKTSPSRLGLYGLMLGLCGTPEDIPTLEEKILDTTEEFRLGIDGLMGGYLLLTGEKGLEKLDAAKLADKKAPFSETYAAMQALRFMWQYGDGHISPDRLRVSMRLLLNRPELADLVIADLARWKDWSIQPELMKLYGAPEYDIPSIKRAIVRFMMASVKDVPAAADTATATEQPAHAKEAAMYLAELEMKDPKTVSDAKRFFFVK